MYDREKMRGKLRDMLRSMGIDVPEELPDWEIIVQDENGNVVERRRMGQNPEKDNEQRTHNG